MNIEEELKEMKQNWVSKKVIANEMIVEERKNQNIYLTMIASLVIIPIVSSVSANTGIGISIVFAVFMGFFYKKSKEKQKYLEDKYA